MIRIVSYFFLAKPIMVDLGIAFAGTLSELFDAQKAFTSKVLDYFTISPNQTHLGVMQYGRERVVVFNFANALNGAEAKREITDLTVQSSGNNLIGALRDAKDKLFSASSGARANIAKSLLIFNAKKTGVDVEEYKTVAGELRGMGVKVVVVGVTTEVGVDELKVINSTEKSLFMVKSSAGLVDIVEPVVQQLLPGMFVLKNANGIQNLD